MKLLLLAALLLSATIASAQVNRYSSLPEQKVVHTYVPQDNRMLLELAKERQKQDIASANEYNAKQKECIQQTKEYYAQLQHTSVQNGWQQATVTCEAANVCSENRFLVEAGKITNIQQSDGSYGPPITSSTSVANGKAMYTRTADDGSLLYFTVYFR